MTYLGKTIIKKEVIKELKPFLKKYNFSLQSVDTNLVILYLKTNLGFKINANVNVNDVLSFHIGTISFIDCEVLFRNILGMPKYLGADLIPFFQFFLSNERYGKINGEVKTIEEVDEVCNNFKVAFTDYYLPTFERYSDPKNVLELWDSLDDKGKSNHFSSPHKNIKIMILSKMCNDESYERRCQEAIDFYTMHYNNGIESAKGLIDDCYKIIKYLEENEI